MPSVQERAGKKWKRAKAKAEEHLRGIPRGQRGCCDGCDHGGALRLSGRGSCCFCNVAPAANRRRRGERETEARVPARAPMPAPARVGGCPGARAERASSGDTGREERRLQRGLLLRRHPFSFTQQLFWLFQFRRRHTVVAEIRDLRNSDPSKCICGSIRALPSMAESENLKSYQGSLPQKYFPNFDLVFRKITLFSGNSHV